jgi:Leucine-rich repeat (LRR) protein
MRVLFVFLGVLFSLNLFSQDLSKEEIADFKKEGKQLISYLQFTLNSIGDNELSPKEKDIIINESYLKMFRDDKVQIEDDLDASRETVTNKDVQAYLKDVDFFFKSVHFNFNILSIDVQIDENGNPFLLTNILRSLKAVDLKGDSIYNDQQRFVEIKLDADNRDLKIASIYTTKLNENEENIRWWNLLPESWREILGDRELLSDSLSFSAVKQLNSDYYLLEHQQPDTLAQTDDGISDSLALNKEIFRFKYDTVWMNDSSQLVLKKKVIATLNKILEIRDLNLSNNSEIQNLEPISKLSNLRTLDISNTQITNIYPIRNLTRLHSLNCSNSPISSVDPLVYSMELAILNLSNTPISSIESLRNLNKLVILDVSNTQIENISALKELKSLKDLKIRNIRFENLDDIQPLTNLSYLDLSDNEQLKDVKPLSQLIHLKVLYCSNTSIKDLKPLSSLTNLEVLYCENAEITNLKGLETLPHLKKIYCDNSLLGRQKAIDFMKQNPQILVVFESKQLQMWWNELDTSWREVFGKLIELDDNPTKEQLHEITNIKEIDISGKSSINTLLPLEKLKNLQKLNAESTAIKNLDGIAQAREMKELNISNTKVQRLYAIESLNLMTDLSFDNCPVNDLNPLHGLVNLKSVSMNNTLVRDLSPLQNLQNLRFLSADNSQVEQKQFEDFIEKNKDLLVIYQTAALEIWWSGLSPAWKSIFNAKMNWTKEPNSRQLHQLIQLRNLKISENRSIDNLKALIKLPHLRSLKINDTKITDVTPLKKLRHLKEIDLSKNPISDLTPLQNLHELTFIYLNNTPIENLEWLAKLKQVKVLDISSTSIKNIKELSEVSHLEKLIAYNTKINNIKALEDLPDLRLLKIYNSKISAKKIATFKKLKPKCAVDFY